MIGKVEVLLMRPLQRGPARRITTLHAFALEPARPVHALPAGLPRHRDQARPGHRRELRHGQRARGDQRRLRVRDQRRVRAGRESDAHDQGPARRDARRLAVRIVVALGGNALLKRGEPMTAEAQRRNVKTAADALAPIAGEHQLLISHGNGPQVGLLALQGAAYKPDEAYPLDVLGAETEGMIGYMIEQELGNLLPVEVPFATVLTMVEVDLNDPGFA